MTRAVPIPRTSVIFSDRKSADRSSVSAGYVDVIDGFVSLQAARDVYGVAVDVLDEDALAYEINGAETARLRA